MTAEQTHTSVSLSNLAHIPAAPLLAWMLGTTSCATLAVDDDGFIMGWNAPFALLAPRLPSVGESCIDQLGTMFGDVQQVVDALEQIERWDQLNDLGACTIRSGTKVRVMVGPIDAELPGEHDGHVWTFRPLEAPDASTTGAASATRIAEHLAFLGSVATRLGSSIDLHDTLDVATSAPLGLLADWSVVYLPDGDGLLRPAITRHLDARSQHHLEQIIDAWLPTHTQSWGINGVMASGTIELIRPRDVIDERLVDVSAAYTALVDQLDTESLLLLPITARGRTIGVLALATAASTRTPRRWFDNERQIAMQYADRVASAIDNAQIYEDAERRARAARVLEHVGDGVVLIDDDGRVIEWNHAASTILGVSARDALGRSIADVIPGWLQLVRRISIVASGSQRPAAARTLPVVTGEGQIWLTISGVRIDDGIAYAFRDVTSEHELERVRTDFVATVSHELRTPLASVYGSALTLQRADLPLDDDVRRQLLSIIANESYRLGSIVNDILAASHIDSGQVQIASRAFDPVRVVCGVIDSARARLDAGLDLRAELPDAGSMHIIGDRDRLQQVLVNLVENAIKYSPDGGTVSVHLAVDSTGRTAQFSVRDEGLGIPERDLEHIFEKFFRVDPRQTRGIGGTGLGLYICRELIARMGGRLTVTSELGVGSTFTIELPLAG